MAHTKRDVRQADRKAAQRDWRAHYQVSDAPFASLAHPFLCDERDEDRHPPKAWRRMFVTKRRRSDDRWLAHMSLRIVDHDDLPAHGEVRRPHYT